MLKMRNAYYVIKNGRPFSDFPKLCLLDESKGLTTGKAYRNIRGCVEFLTAIAESIRIETSELLSRAKFLSLTMDGTTDVAGDEQENLYLRCCIAGEVINKYISTYMPLSATSEGVYQCLINEVKQNDIDMNKLVGFGSDGAATMMGIRNGVGTRLKGICPDITLIHCLAHRLELCFKDAIKKSQYYDKAQTLLIGLYYFIRKSPKQKRGLLMAFEANNMKACLLTKCGGTRWIGHQVRAIAAFLKSFQAIVDYLSNHSNEILEKLASEYDQGDTTGEKLASASLAKLVGYVYSTT